uniref:DUF4371 domain-containing protein n=1 Tax=Sinocyclocheilus anshuiensis TaxID=1608454 RepID=A0A671SGU4_9TELE
MLLTDTLFDLILTIILLQKPLKIQVQVQVTLGAFSYLPPFLIIHGNSLSENRAAIMDRWLKKLDGPSTSGPDTSQENSGPPEKIRITDTKTRQYQDNYKMFGFTATTTEPAQPLCFLCGEVLSNHAMKPSHLHRHLRTKHSSCVGRSAEFFHRKYSEFQKSQDKFKAATQMCSSSLLASYEVSLLVAKSKKPYSIAEELIVPAAAILTETMLDKKAATAIKTVPLSNDNIFALQLDESTDISGESQLVAFVRYKDTDDISEHILFCKPMLGKTTGEDIFNVADSFFHMCSHICTDGAASMMGRIHGFVSRVKQVHPGIKTMHCIIHREALASKRLSPKLNEVLNDAVKIITFIKSRPLNARLFKKLCDEVGTEHHQLLLHTNVLGDFLSEHLHPLSALLTHLAYLADIFNTLLRNVSTEIH